MYVCCIYIFSAYTGGLGGCRNTNCTLKLIDDIHYQCCCQSDICNLESRIIFPPISPVIPTVSSTEVKLVSTSSFYSSVIGSVSPTPTANSISSTSK